MNINNVKAAINAQTSSTITTLMMVRQMVTPKEGGEPQKSAWLSHWDNTSRVRVTMHENVSNTIKANPNFDGLATKYELVAPHGNVAAYHKFLVVIPNVEATF